jgi:hypothetical protein
VLIPSNSPQFDSNDTLLMVLPNVHPTYYTAWNDSEMFWNFSCGL